MIDRTSKSKGKRPPSIQLQRSICSHTECGVICSRPGPNASPRTLYSPRDPPRPLFTPLHIAVGLQRRVLTVPVLSFLLPSSSTIVTHKRRDSHARQPAPFSPIVVVYVVLTVVLVVLPIAGMIVAWVFIRSRRSTLVITAAEVERIWRFEIASGNFPSTRPPDIQLRATSEGDTLGLVENPMIPSGTHAAGSIFGVGLKRVYRILPLNKLSPIDARHSPSRPAFGSTLDLDVIMKHCDFSTGKYVRDCLEILRINGGLQSSVVRRGRLDAWKATYFTDGPTVPQPDRDDDDPHTIFGASTSHFAEHVQERHRRTLQTRPSRSVVPTQPHSSHPSADPICDPRHPHLFHVFWAGPFTDKPYAAALSFLYTQNLRLYEPVGSGAPADICRPQLWIWINPGPASSLPNDNAEQELREEMSRNPWSAPLLHPRFSESLKFQLWNTTEQLDGVDELHGWRHKPLFQSHGKKYGSTKAQDATVKSQGKMFDRVGSATSKDYDRLSVVLSDMARFVLTYRYGGVYIDADTLLLRDWEELFNWRGAFAYRWSRLPLYNTAVVKMQRGSALGRWVFKTAAANGMDFHPMTLARYTRDAGLDGLLLRLPDALFDPPWLNIEDYQRDRPVYPDFKSFDDFFETPATDSAAPSAIGFDGFFRGAFSYHWHNAWWRPFDPERNYPDLGPRFGQVYTNHTGTFKEPTGDNITDLSWSMALKRQFEAYLRGEAPNMYGEWINYDSV